MKEFVNRRVRVYTAGGGSFLGTISKVEGSLLFLKDTFGVTFETAELNALDGVLVDTTTVVRIHVFKDGVTKLRDEE